MKHFTRMTGRLLGSASDAHLDTLLSGLGALQDELRWFQRKAQERGLSLEVPMQAANKHYTDFMASLSASSYAVQVRAPADLVHFCNKHTHQASEAIVHAPLLPQNFFAASCDSDITQLRHALRAQCPHPSRTAAQQ